MFDRMTGSVLAKGEGSSSSTIRMVDVYKAYETIPLEQTGNLAFYHTHPYSVSMESMTPNEYDTLKKILGKKKVYPSESDISNIGVMYPFTKSAMFAEEGIIAPGEHIAAWRGQKSQLYPELMFRGANLDEISKIVASSGKPADFQNLMGGIGLDTQIITGETRNVVRSAKQDFPSEVYFKAPEGYHPLPRGSYSSGSNDFGRIMQEAREANPDREVAVVFSPEGEPFASILGESLSVPREYTEPVLASIREIGGEPFNWRMVHTHPLVTATIDFPSASDVSVAANTRIQGFGKHGVATSEGVYLYDIPKSKDLYDAKQLDHDALSISMQYLNDVTTFLEEPSGVRHSMAWIGLKNTPGVKASFELYPLKSRGYNAPITPEEQVGMRDWTGRITELRENIFEGEQPKILPVLQEIQKSGRLQYGNPEYAYIFNLQSGELVHTVPGKIGQVRIYDTVQKLPQGPRYGVYHTHVESPTAFDIAKEGLRGVITGKFQIKPAVLGFIDYLTHPKEYIAGGGFPSKQDLLASRYWMNEYKSLTGQTTGVVEEGVTKPGGNKHLLP